MGLSFDDRRSFATIDPGYVRWTQWIFSRIYDAWYDPEATNPSGSKGCARPIADLVAEFESGTRAIPGHDGKVWNELTAVEQADVLNEFRLAYISKSPVNWCPGLGTVLANEEVTAEGKSERGNFPVFQRELRQWSMRITAYGHRLISDLDTIDWPEKVKLMQRNWNRRIARRLRALHGRDPVRRRGHGDLHHPSRHAVRHHIRRGLPGAPPAGLRAGRLAAGHPPSPGPAATPRRRRP